MGAATDGAVDAGQVLDAAVEAREVPRHGPLERPNRFSDVADVELRQPLVGVDSPVVEPIETLRPESHLQAVIEIADLTPALEVDAAGDADVTAEIPKVIPVADRAIVDQREELPEPGLVIDPVHPALCRLEVALHEALLLQAVEVVARQLAVEDVVPVEIGPDERGLSPAFEVPELSFEARTPVADEAWRHGRVVVRRQVDVIGCPDIQPVALGEAQIGKEKTGLPVIAHRKAEIWHVEDRQVPHSHDRMPRGGEHLVVPDLEG